jgi:antitoxin component YwqK of YwqJK toxin-antitoxin module
MIKLTDIMREMKVHTPGNRTDKKGLKQGYWEHYDDNRKLQSKGFYKDGLHDGIWEFYMENGDLNYKGLFKNGKFVKII